MMKLFLNLKILRNSKWDDKICLHNFLRLEADFLIEMKLWWKLEKFISRGIVWLEEHKHTTHDTHPHTKH